MQPWHYDPPADLEQPLLERLRRFPREPDMLVFGMRWLTASVLRTWLRLYHRLAIVGRERLPLDRSFVMVANHASHLDTLCLLAALPMARLHHAFPAAAQDFFFVGGLRTLAATVVANAPAVRPPPRSRAQPRGVHASAGEPRQHPDRVPGRDALGAAARWATSSPAWLCWSPAPTSPSCRVISTAHSPRGPKAPGCRGRARSA